LTAEGTASAEEIGLGSDYRHRGDDNLKSALGRGQVVLISEATSATMSREERGRREGQRERERGGGWFG
jgi:hypothetical protein